MKDKVNKVISFLGLNIVKKSNKILGNSKVKKVVKKRWEWLMELSWGQKFLLLFAFLIMIFVWDERGKIFWFLRRGIMKDGYLEVEKKKVLTLEGVKVELPEEALIHEARVRLTKVGKKKVSKPEELNKMGEIYKIESSSLLNENSLVTFEKKSRDEIFLLSSDGKNWQWRDPQRGFNKTYDISEFGLLTLGEFKSLNEVFVKKDIKVSGRVKYYWRPKFDWPDRQLRNVPEGIKIGLFLKLGEGVWGQEIEGKIGLGGRYEVVIPKGRVYGISGKGKLEFKMRIYTEKKDVGSVSELRGGRKERIYFETKLIEVEEGREKIEEDWEIADDKAAAFNIVDLISSANLAVKKYTSKLVGPVEVVLGDFSSFLGGEEKTGFDDIEGVILVDRRPPAEWDGFEILSAYGEFVMYSLRGRELSRSHLGGRLVLGEKLSNELAYQQGWSWFFAGLALGTSDYKVYRDNLGEVPFFEVNLEYDPKNHYGANFPGGAAEIFWDLADGQEELVDTDKDGVMIPLKSIFEAVGANILGKFPFYHRPTTIEEYYRSLLKHDLGEVSKDDVCVIFRRNGVKAGECNFLVMDEEGKGKNQETGETIGERKIKEEEKDQGKVQKK
jgi:hypothetical protein